jgi:pectinesterase
MLDKGSDRARFTEVDILSYQDTLFPDAGSQPVRALPDRRQLRLHLRRGTGLVRAVRDPLAPRPVDPIDGYIVAPSTPIEPALRLRLPSLPADRRTRA